MECARSLPRSGLNAEISSRPINIPARQLQPPGIAFGERRTESAVRFLPPMNDGSLTSPRKDTGQWNMKDKKYYQPGYISEWAVINFTNERGIDQIMKDLTQCCNSRGIFSILDHRNIVHSSGRDFSSAWSRRSRGGRKASSSKDPICKPANCRGTHSDK